MPFESLSISSCIAPLKLLLEVVGLCGILHFFRELELTNCKNAFWANQPDSCPSLFIRNEFDLGFVCIGELFVNLALSS